MRLKKKNKAPILIIIYSSKYILQLIANTKIIQDLNIQIENKSNKIYQLSIKIYHLSIMYIF